MASTERTVRVKFKGDASGLNHAALTGEKAMAGWSDKMGKVGERAGKNASEGFARGSRKGDKDFGASGKRGGRSFLGGIIGALSKGAGAAATALSEGLANAPQMVKVGARLLPILAPSILFMASLLGSMASAAIVTGIGVGVAGAGIALAFRNPKVKAAGAALGEEVLAGFTDAGKSFQKPVMDAIGMVRAEFRSSLPEIKGMFQDASGFVRPLTAGLLGFARAVLPGIRKAVQAAAPLISIVQRMLPKVGEAISGLLTRISSHGRELAMGLTVAFGLVISAIKGTGVVLGFLLTLFGKFMDMGRKVFEFFDRLGMALSTLPGGLGAIGKGIVAVTRPALNGMANFENMMADIGKGATSTEDDFAGLKTETKLMNMSMADAIKTTGSLSAAFDAINGKALSAREAESNYQAAIDAVTDSVKENGRTLDLNTEKGRANDTVLRGLVTASRDKAQAVYDETLATKGAGAAQTAASAVYEQGRRQLIKSAIQMGLNKTEAKALADKIMGIPKTWTTKTAVETTKANAAITYIINRLKGLDGKEYVTYVKVVTRGGIDRITTNTGGGREVNEARGGFIRGPGTGTSDSIPARLSNGEYVLRAAAVKALGTGFLNQLNDSGPGQGARSYLDAPLSTRSGGSASVATATAVPEIRVFIGDQELRGMVRVEVSEQNRGLKRGTMAGAGARR